MSRLPRIIGENRGRSIALVAVLALGQAAAAGVAAFATRDVFAAFRDDSAILPLLALAAVAAAGLAIALLRVGERVVAERVGQNYAASLRLKLFAHLTEMSARDVAARRNGGLAMRFVGDLAAVRGWVSLGIARLVSASIVLPVATGVLFLLNVNLGIAASIPIVLGLGVMILAGPRLGPAHKRLRSRRARLAADMSERIPHAPELRLLGRIRTEKAHLLRRTEKLIASAMARARGAAVLRAVPDVVSGFAAASLFLMALSSGVAAAEAAGALAAVGLMVQPMRDLAGVWDRHRAWVAARDKCEALLAAPKLKRAALQGRDPLENAPPPLRFAEVSAGALENVTVAASPGQKIAIVGGNGAGKSTLISLAAGLEQPRDGAVTLGGLPPSSLGAAERRRMITLVGVRSPILAGSLRRALIMGVAEQPGDEAILAEAEAFGLKEVIVRLGGLDGKLAEGGRNLSAGEVRRVLLTRAALSGSKLMLLDEPDDALDVEGPELVERLVRQSDATALIITHNLALARRMDTLWFIEDGRILETGSPADLLAGNGPAARFFAPRCAA
ncbi:ABC transporter ATP-binding protein [Pelagibius litoralis]|uniref:ABC transporter ATP-binding protein n=1 Tax=Pelagibius litoralis TaxID=374515 RepID=A0A967F3I2_9PROT|nr:ABC transporter ATP-binding protein [Pelagibius litoralis]NIA72425.1 ABC transporter ATP-binding protein [Pelagibius litoralis]